MRREACSLLSNILADIPEDNDSVFENKVLPILLQLLQYDIPEVNNILKGIINFFLKIRFEATICIFNLMSRCSASETQMLVSAGIIEILLLNVQEDHRKLVRASLDALYNILAFGDKMKEIENGINPYAQRVVEFCGVNIFENLQAMKTDQRVLDKCSRLLDDFFDGRPPVQ